MEDEEYDADLIEETSSKIVYKRSSTTGPPLDDEPPSSPTDVNDESGLGHSIRSGDSDVEESRDESIRRSASWLDVLPKGILPQRRRSSLPDRGSFERTEFSRREGSLSSPTGRMDSGPGRRFSGADVTDSESAMPYVKDGLKRWSEKARLSSGSKDQNRLSWPLRPSELDPLRRRSSDKAKAYYAVTKWAVDYTNKNYIRSKCHKPIGHHRYVLGKQFDWDVDYDNNYYLRSKVNAPKGLHRRIKDIKRKRVPDKDILADSRGWEFEYGPEFPQIEEDVPYMPEERTVTRGAYRCYGVPRNDSDSDIKLEGRQREERHDIIKGEFKYGAEFLQDDVPHIVQPKDRRIGRGAYRFYDVPRSKCDDYQSGDELDGSEEEFLEETDTPKEAKFKRTILKKTLKIPKAFPKKKGFGTQLTLNLGEGNRDEYEGISTTLPSLRTKRHPSIRSAFKKNKERSSPEMTEEIRTSLHKKDFNPRDVWKKHKQRSILEKPRLPGHSPIFKPIREEEDLTGDSETDEVLPDEIQPRRRSTSIRGHDDRLRSIHETQPRRQSTLIREHDDRTPTIDETQPRRRSTSIREDERIPSIHEIEPRRRSTSIRGHSDRIPPIHDTQSRRRSTSIREDERIPSIHEIEPRRRSTSIRGHDERIPHIHDTQPRRRSTSIREQDDSLRTSTSGLRKHEKRRSSARPSLPGHSPVFKDFDEQVDTNEVFGGDIQPRRSIKEEDDRIKRSVWGKIKEKQPVRSTDDDGGGIFISTGAWKKPKESFRDEEQRRRSSAKMKERASIDDRLRRPSIPTSPALWEKTYDDRFNDENRRRRSSRNMNDRIRTSTVSRRSNERVGDEDHPRRSIYSVGDDDDDQTFTSMAVWGKPSRSRSPEKLPRISASNSRSNDQVFASTAVWGKTSHVGAAHSKRNKRFSLRREYSDTETETHTHSPSSLRNKTVWTDELTERKRDHIMYIPRISNHNLRSKDKKFNSKDAWKKVIQKKVLNSKWKEIFSEDEHTDEEYREHHRNKNEVVHVEENEGKMLKRLPPHVKNRIRSLRSRMSNPDSSRQEKHLRLVGDRKKNKFREDDFDIDLRKHRHHPNDYGHSNEEGYEKYVDEDGNKLWLKAEEKYSELHHRH